MFEGVGARRRPYPFTRRLATVASPVDPEGGWRVEFRYDGPWAGKTKSFASEPDDVIEVPPEEGGPFTYRRSVEVPVWQSEGPVRLIYDPDPSMDPNA
jgi:hypothetical protein